MDVTRLMGGLVDSKELVHRTCLFAEITGMLGFEGILKSVENDVCAACPK
jgi:hypothetical protein